MSTFRTIDKCAREEFETQRTSPLTQDPSSDFGVLMTSVWMGGKTCHPGNNEIRIYVICARRNERADVFDYEPRIALNGSPDGDHDVAGVPTRGARRAVRSTV